MSVHRSKAWWLWAAVAATTTQGAACSSNGVQTRQIILNVSEKCSPPTMTSGVPVNFHPAGDFKRDPGVILTLDQVGAAVGIPLSTQSLEVSFAQLPQFLGVREMPPAGDVDVLAWPVETACPLSESVQFDPGEALGLIDDEHALLVPETTPPALIDLTTGVITRMPSGLHRLRSGATVTPLQTPGVGALIAGGRNPSDASVLNLAEVYDAGPGGSLGSIQDGFVVLQDFRADAGAVVLAAGETLLVGGTGSAGEALGSMESVGAGDVQKGQSQRRGSLQVARTKPNVVRLPNGKVVIAGGTSASQQAVTSIEWLRPDLSPPEQCADLPGGGMDGSMHPWSAADYLVAPMEGDAVVVVVVPVSTMPGTPPVFIANPCDCGSPCAPQAAPAVPVSVTSDARLFPAGKGSPLLWSGTAWLRWDPWAGQFNALTIAMPSGPLAGAPSLAPDPGLALWISNSGSVRGMRVDARGPFATDPIVGPSDTAPAQPAGPAASWSSGLNLAPGASAFLTDATFAHVTISANLPLSCLLVLRDPIGNELDVGGSDCPVTGLDSAAGVVVERDGPSVSVTDHAGKSVHCAKSVGQERLMVGWRAAGAACLVRNPSVSR